MLRCLACGRTIRQMDEQQMGYSRTAFMFERTGSKRIFERFLGAMAALAGEVPFYVLEVNIFNRCPEKHGMLEGRKFSVVFQRCLL